MILARQGIRKTLCILQEKDMVQQQEGILARLLEECGEPQQESHTVEVNVVYQVGNHREGRKRATLHLRPGLSEHFYSLSA